MHLPRQILTSRQSPISGSEKPSRWRRIPVGCNRSSCVHDPHSAVSLISVYLNHSSSTCRLILALHLFPQRFKLLLQCFECFTHGALHFPFNFVSLGSLLDLASKVKIVDLEFLESGF